MCDYEPKPQNEDTHETFLKENPESNWFDNANRTTVAS